MRDGEDLRKLLDANIDAEGIVAGVVEDNPSDDSRSDSDGERDVCARALRRSNQQPPADRGRKVLRRNQQSCVSHSSSNIRSDSNGTRTRIFACISHQGAVGCVKRTSPSRIST
eukprot:jgi/Tetstr1/453488/TSEL_040457.t1